MRCEIGVHPWAKFVQPYLDGEPLKHCRMADEELGCAEVYHTEMTAGGRERRLDARVHGTRMLFGQVEIRPTEDVTARIKANPDRARDIWDDWYEATFGDMDREIAALKAPSASGPWEARAGVFDGTNWQKTRER